MEMPLASDAPAQIKKHDSALPKLEEKGSNHVISFAEKAKRWILGESAKEQTVNLKASHQRSFRDSARGRPL